LSKTATIDVPVDGELHDSAPELDDGGALAARYRRDGYLFLRGALDTEPLLRARAALTGVLVRAGLAEPDRDEPIWTGADPAGLDELALFRPQAELRYLAESDVCAVIERAWGHAPFAWRSVGVFANFPDDDAFIAPPHQDRFFPDEDADSYATAWVPLVTIDDECGGLAVAAGSHRTGRRAESALEGVRMRRGTDAVNGLRLEDVPERWLAASMEPGDLLVFHSLAVHSALPNTSPRIRLALGVRFQRADVPLSPLARYSKLEHAERRRRVREHLDAAGVEADRYLVFRVHDEIVKRGLEPTRRVVDEVVAALT
jgi:1-deoxypentalenic acid 11beta-hydroxylase